MSSSSKSAPDAISPSASDHKVPDHKDPVASVDPVVRNKPNDQAESARHVSVTPDVLMPEPEKVRKRRHRSAPTVIDSAVVRPSEVTSKQTSPDQTLSGKAAPAAGRGTRSARQDRSADQDRPETAGTATAGRRAPRVEVLAPEEASALRKGLRGGSGSRTGGKTGRVRDLQEERFDSELADDLGNPELREELGSELDNDLNEELDEGLDDDLNEDLNDNLQDDLKEDLDEGMDDGLGRRREVRYLTSREPGEDTLPAPAGARLPSVRDNFQLYVREVCRFPLLKPEEEHELAVRFRDTQDKEAAFKLISSHLRLVVKIAMDFQRRWMQNVLDLVQEGNVGLIHALYKFDPDKGIKFSYYSSFWIKAYILKFIMDNFRMVKLGTTQVQRKLFFNLNRERQKLVAQGFNPDAEMLSKHLGVSKNDILEMEQRLSSSDVSLNVPVNDDNDSASRIDFLPALDQGIEERIANEEISRMIHTKLKTLLPKLSEKELYILNNRLFTDSPETLREIGERYNITRERVRQLEIRLLEKIKKHLAGDIKDFSETWIQS